MCDQGTTKIDVQRLKRCIETGQRGVHPERRSRLAGSCSTGAAWGCDLQDRLGGTASRSFHPSRGFHTTDIALPRVNHVPQAASSIDYFSSLISPSKTMLTKPIHQAFHTPGQNAGDHLIRLIGLFQPARQAADKAWFWENHRCKYLIPKRVRTVSIAHCF